MRRIIAAVDESAASAPVVRAAQALAPLFDADVEVVTVREDGTGTAAAAAANLPFRVLEGSPVDRIVEASEEPEVAATVLGTRRHPTGPRPAGSTALAVVPRAQKPVVVVPPEWEPTSEFCRAVVPLDATDEASRSVRAAIGACALKGLDIVVVHVFTERTVPLFWDHPVYEDDEWAREFLSRHCAEPGARIELRRGAPAAEVLDLIEPAGDLVVLAWSQDLSGGHAHFVREVLADAAVPVILIPVTRAEELAA